MQSFGDLIRDARRRKGLNQKGLAARIMKGDGTPISQQYIVDIEHSKRNPPSDEMIEQFAGVLELDRDLLLITAGRLPRDIQLRLVEEPEHARRLFGELRGSGRGGRRRLG